MPPRDNIADQQAAQLLASLAGSPSPSARPLSTDKDWNDNRGSDTSAAGAKIEMNDEPATGVECSIGGILEVAHGADGERPTVDEDTQRAIAEAQNEYGTRVRQSKKQHGDMVPTPAFDDLKPTNAKKRPAPASAKQNGARKHPPKRPRIDITEQHGPIPRLSSTPSAIPLGSKSNRGPSNPATPRSSTPAVRSSPAGNSESYSDDDGEVYCICRKPDNHQFMIGCDGGCEDWFHGKCVNMKKEDENLVDKYICPNCQERGRGVTTWKPMCRMPGCRKPARLKKGSESKYCSDDCGVKFMDLKLETVRTGKAPRLDRRNRVGYDGNLQAEEIDPLGGTTRPAELKALALAADNLPEFQMLGSSAILEPPPGESTQVPPQPVVTLEDSTRLGNISNRKHELRERRLLLKDRSVFIGMAKERASAQPKGKEICGFDSRLAWDEKSFASWRRSPEGNAAFERGSLELPDVNMVESAPEACLRSKRCERHRGWQKLVLQDVRFEEAGVGDEMRRIDAEEKEIRQNAILRATRGLSPHEDAEDPYMDIDDKTFLNGDGSRVEYGAESDSGSTPYAGGIPERKDEIMAH